VPTSVPASPLTDGLPPPCPTATPGHRRASTAERAAIYAAPLRNYRVRMKEALVFQGILKNAVVRAPLPSASDEERTLIRRALSHAGLL
jgi:dihydrodipicolinate synthase/N-acetylneuraminate lyase